MKDVQETLERLVPEPARVSDWDAVLRDARPRRRSHAWQLAAATSVVALAALFVVAPWKSSERVGILDRALAAVGDGPVLHLVLRDEWRGTLVDLRTGERKPLYNEREMWIDPERGFVLVERFGGVATDRHVATPSEIERPFVIAASDYHDALESGRAEVADSGVVDGIPVYWIRVLHRHEKDVGDGRGHDWAMEVGVSKESYAPVYIREVRDGNRVEGTGTRVLTAEQLPEGSGDFTPTPRSAGRAYVYGPSPDRISRAEAWAILGGHGVWLGPEFDGLPLRAITALTLKSGYSPETQQWAEDLKGIRLVYADQVTAEGWPKTTPSILILQAPRNHPALQLGLGPYSVPPGHVALTEVGAYMTYEGTFVAIRLPLGKRGEELALAAARALRPLSDGSGAGG